MALYNILQKFPTYTLYHWETGGTGRSTTTKAGSFNHKYWMIQYFCFPVAESIGSCMLEEVSSTYCKASRLLFSSLCPLLLKKIIPKVMAAPSLDQ